MNKEINPVSVIKALLEMVKEDFSCNYNAVPRNEEILIAKLLYKSFAEITTEYYFEDDDELTESPDCEDQDAEWIDSDGKILQNTVPVTVEQKEKILNLIQANPNWSAKTIQNKYPYYDPKRKSLLTEQVKNGGTYHEIYAKIREHVKQRFIEARKNLVAVHDNDLRKWAIQKSIEFPSIHFKASEYWLTNFKRNMKIRSRKITKIVSRNDVKSMDEIMSSVQRFRDNIKKLIPKYDMDMVWNTDQVGFQYELTSKRTLSWVGEKATWAIGLSPKNKATHSYTVQYIINMAGEIVGNAFVCLQEQTGKLGPKVKEKLFDAKNLTITCSTSGKLSKTHVQYFLDNVVTPEVNSKKFLYIFDSWNGQINDELYEDRFIVNGENLCCWKIVPEKCTPYCQPLDTTFNRQHKILAKKMYEYALLHECEEEPCNLTTRNSILKLQSLCHFVLSAPIFKAMIKYSWKSAGLTLEDERDVFLNMNEACFNLLKKSCEHDQCFTHPFIRCSHCRSHLCFNHFYHNYHLAECPNYNQTERKHVFALQTGVSDEPGPRRKIQKKYMTST